MPRVNGEEFPYSEEGMKEAKKLAEETGKKMTMQKYKGGKIKTPKYKDLVQKKYGGRI